MGSLDGTEAEVEAEVAVEAVSEGAAESVSEGVAEGASEDETGAEASLSEDAENPAAEPIVPVEAQPDSSNPPTAATMPMPVLRRRGAFTREGYLNRHVHLRATESVSER